VICLHCHAPIPAGSQVRVPPGGYAHRGCERRARLSARSELQRDAAGMCDAAAERILTEIRRRPEFSDAMQDAADAAIWIGRAADALRQAQEFLAARALENRAAAMYRPGEDS
jgi:pantoate kinase